jgi:ribosomal protein S18 acetylase RimI-like enzyme
VTTGGVTGTLPTGAVVVASNTGAVALWQSLGFAVIGRQPDAFRHPHLGLVDALVMHRTL